MSKTTDPNDPVTRLTAELARRAEQTGLVLFDGQWMTEEEANQKYRRLKLDSRINIGEMMLVLALIFFAANMPIVVLALLGGIAG